TYDLLNHLLSMGIDTSWRKNIFRIARPVKDQRVIDLCSGTGDLSKLLHNKGGKTVSLDFSINMLRRGIERKALLGDSVAADACNIPFKDNTFHTATIAFGIRNIPDLDHFMVEVNRVLVPGGQLIILELTRPENKMVNAFYKTYLGRILPFVGGVVSGEKSAYQYLSGTIETFVDPGALQKMLERHDFIHVVPYPQTWRVATILVCEKRWP
ncbi:MAG: ubiquinone/menaquinone biosynthesis methyltransferase, partial [Proteobacteria bacterium]|nr:ubiquinone/menaquinone biosynthesis methyltransferase [Pseudomonadota bacterium]